MSAEESPPIAPRGTYVAAANGVVAGQYLLDKADHPAPPVYRPPAGFRRVGANRSWRVYQRCT